MENLKENYRVFLEKKRLFIWLAIVFFFTWVNLMAIGIFTSLILTLVYYAIIITIVVSPGFETLILRTEDARTVATATEKEKLNHLFEEVVKEIEIKNHIPLAHLKLYIQDTSTIRAFSIYSTITVSRGLMLFMNDEEIKAIIAHEIAHIVNKDSFIQNLLSFCTSIYIFFFVLIKIIFVSIKNCVTEKSLMANISSFFIVVTESFISFFLLLCSVILGAESREREFIADKFAFDAGYEESMISALYKLYDMQISDKKALIDQLCASHPKVALRIEKLESLLESIQE